MNKIKLIIIFILANFSLIGQINEFKAQEDSIQKLFNKIISTKNDSEKLKFNNEIENTFNQILKKKNSFDFAFGKLKHVSKLSSGDELVRIFTWNLPFTDGTFKYYGFIQLKSKNNSISLIKLTDKSKEVTSPEQTIFNNTNWYGALYYKILTNTYKNKTYYTLLGWDGNDNFTNKKLIDVLIIKRKKAQFGSAIFKMENKMQHRIIFEYSQQAKMMLSFDKKQNMIVFDHLAPSLKKFKDQYMYYGPDLSQDGLVFIEGNWVLKQNLDLRNQKQENNKPIKTSN